MATETKKRPAFEAKAGLVRATVWPNETKDGIRYNATLTRRYKDGETWKSTPSLGERDLMDGVRALVEAEAWIRQQSAETTKKAS
jgi:hypothetical protein